MTLLLLLSSIWMRWQYSYSNIVDTQSLEKNPFVCIDMTSTPSLDATSNEGIHFYYYYRGILERRNLRGRPGELRWKEKVKQRRIPNHGKLGYPDDREDGLIKRPYVKKGLCQDMPSLSGYLSFQGFQLPLLSGMKIDQHFEYIAEDRYTYSLSGTDMHFVLAKSDIPKGAEVFSMTLDGKKYLFYLYFSAKENPDLFSGPLHDFLNYTNYPTQFKNIHSNSERDFFALYKDQERLLVYGLLGVPNAHGGFDISFDDRPLFWNYFQLLPLKMYISKRLL